MLYWNLLQIRCNYNDRKKYWLYCSSYNKKEDDFATLRQYNDYLEEIETIGKLYWLTIVLNYWYLIFYN